MDGWAARWKLAGVGLSLAREFVARTKYVGLYVLLCVPLMTDTLPVYLFSIFNKKGVMTMPFFVVTCFAGGATRALLLYFIFGLFGIILV